MTGIIDTIKLAGTLVFALPAAFAGVHFLAAGETIVGAVLVALAVLLVVIQHRLTTPGDIPGLVAKRLVGTVAEDDTDENRSP